MRWFFSHKHKLGMLAAAGLILSGCAANNVGSEPARVEARPAPVPLPPSSQRREANRAVKPPRAKPANPVLPAPVVSIAGLSEDEVVRVMGEPQMRAERNGRRIWTYRGDACHVEVTFFRDVTRDAYAALAHKVVQAGGTTGGSCVREMGRVARD